MAYDFAYTSTTFLNHCSYHYFKLDFENFPRFDLHPLHYPTLFYFLIIKTLVLAPTFPLNRYPIDKHNPNFAHWKWKGKEEDPHLQQWVRNYCAQFTSKPFLFFSCSLHCSMQKNFLFLLVVLETPIISVGIRQIIRLCWLSRQR